MPIRLFDPEKVDDKKTEAPAAATVVNSNGELQEESNREFKGNLKLFERWIRYKQYILLKTRKKKEGESGKQTEKKRSLFGIFFW